MGKSKAVDGYYYTDIHEHSAQKLDHSKEWAVLSAPEIESQSPGLYFIADHSGRIYVKKLKSPPAIIKANGVYDKIMNKHGF